MPACRALAYEKVLHLPLSFFSEERKGDIIARMSSDVGAVESCITSSINMLIRQPIAILVCFATMLWVSWQLTVFVIVVAPIAGWIMGTVSRKLKSQSAMVQGLWGSMLAQLDETLGGLRIIKAFIAEKKMLQRFVNINDEFRKNASAMLFVGAKVSHLALLPQGKVEAADRVKKMVCKMDELGLC